MKGLLLKDFYNLSGQAKLYALYPILGVILSYTQRSMTMMLFLFAMMIVSIPMSSFSYDDMSAFTPYALTLPISRKQLVLSKFILAFIVTLIVIVAYMLCSFLLMQVAPPAYFHTSFQELAIGCLAACFVLNAMNCMIIPLLFRFGSEKGRIFLVMIPVVGFALFCLLSPTFSTLSQTTLQSIDIFLTTYGVYVAALFALVIEVVGIRVANRIMLKKEF